MYIKPSELHKHIDRYNLTLFNGYRVPYIKPQSEDYSYLDFRFRDSYPQQGGRKYFYKSDSVMINNIHSALLRSSRISPYRRLETIYYRLYGRNGKSWIYSFLLKIISKILKLKVVPIKEGYFLHYTGITNNWKSKYWNRKVETIKSDGLISLDIPKLFNSVNP
jgi:hypothetical protein